MFGPARSDGVMYASDTVQRLSRARKKRGVSDKVLDEALGDVAG